MLGIWVMSLPLQLSQSFKIATVEMPMWPFFPINLPRINAQAPTGYRAEKALREAELRRLRAQDRRWRFWLWRWLWQWAKRRTPKDLR
jgi:hypothetical protein